MVKSTQISSLKEKLLPELFYHFALMVLILIFYSDLLTSNENMNDLYAQNGRKINPKYLALLDRKI